MWSVDFDNECAKWFWTLERDLRLSILSVIQLLEERRPNLSRPYSDTIIGSSLPNLKELRVKHRKNQWRILYVFDPRRKAILLVGGNKTGNPKWYKQNIPIAETRYEEHLKRLEKEHGN